MTDVHDAERLKYPTGRSRLIYFQFVHCSSFSFLLYERLHDKKLCIRPGSFLSLFQSIATALTPTCDLFLRRKKIGTRQSIVIAPAIRKSSFTAWNTGGWTSPFILSCFALSLIGLVVFLSVELNIRHPLIDLSLLKNFNFGISNLVLFIFGMGMFGSTFLLPLYLQNGLGYTAFQAGSLFIPLGFIMAVMGPISGVLSDKINPKIPAMIGIVLLALSLFVNYYLSLFSMQSDIMVSLYLRGFGMAFIFTPLNTLSLSDIPRERMAQASGLFNVIRQVGGSFGVAIMGTLLTDRTVFHTTMYGQSVSPSSPVVQNVLLGLKTFAQQALGGPMAEAALRAQALLVYNVSQQAFVSAVDDDFFVAAAITIVCVIPVLLLRYKKPTGPREKVVAID